MTEPTHQTIDIQFMRFHGKRLWQFARAYLTKNRELAEYLARGYKIPDYNLLLRRADEEGAKKCDALDNARRRLKEAALAAEIQLDQHLIDEDPETLLACEDFSQLIHGQDFYQFFNSQYETAKKNNWEFSMLACIWQAFLDASDPPAPIHQLRLGLDI